MVVGGSMVLGCGLCGHNWWWVGILGCVWMVFGGCQWARGFIVIVGG